MVHEAEKTEEEEDQESERETAQCRICLGDEVRDLHNPIISPCSCKGTMKFIHLNCLRAWVMQRTIVKERQNTTMITWKSLNCELCKAPFPFAVSFNGRIYELITYKPPTPPYAVFELCNKEGVDSSGLCIMSFSKKKVLRIVISKSLILDREDTMTTTSDLTR